MKFIISVVILALAVCSEAGYLPAVVDISAGPWGAGPWAAAPWGGWGAHAYGPSLTTTSWGSWGAPLAPLAFGPTTAYHVDSYPNGHDGKYVAANRGAVHIAPNLGHIKSVQSTNLSPAPGTTY